MTPEGRIKNKIKRVLDKYRETLYVYMPVPGGYGGPTLDFLGAIRSVAFAIEAKRPGQKPTPRQQATIATMRRGGVEVFVIDGDLGAENLDVWLQEQLERRA